MNLMTVMERFPDDESCIAHLEKIRWGDKPTCPYCESENVARKKEKDKIGRWNCHLCKSSFNVLAKTMFQGTHIPLQKWFVGIALVVNAKKSLSSSQLGRDLGLNQRSAWYMMHRIRAEMARKSPTLLQGIIEADETYIGGKPRKRNKRKDDKPNKRGRGTKKTPVLGAVERGGNVKAQVASDLTGRGILTLFFIRMNKSRLITDEFQGYWAMSRNMRHDVINHSEHYVVGDVHTNTIEGFWSLLKRAWYGQHHHYRKRFTPLYVSEACWKYNHRKTENCFDVFMRGCFA